MTQIIRNLFYSVRFWLFKKYCKRVDFSKNKLVFSDDFKTLDNFNVKDGEFYNDNDVYFSKDAITLIPEGVNIVCYEDTQTRETYQGKRTTSWTSGMIDTYDKFLYPMGIWVITAKICDSWPAIWLLKKDRSEYGYTRNQITPEIDIMEVMLVGQKDVVRHTAHWGYSDIVYRRFGIGKNIFKCDNDWHEFAVELLPNGYNFYVDGIKTATFVSKDPEFVTAYPNYLLLNNAAHPGNSKNTEFIVKSVKVYEN